MKVSPACIERRPGNRAPPAPACRLPVGGYSPSVPTIVQRGPMTEPKPANGGDDDAAAYFRPSGSTRVNSGTGTRAGTGGPVQRDFERGLSLARLTVVLPVVVLVLSGVGAYIYGTAMAV